MMASPLAEKPAHQKYLEEFRTQQCPLFLQHKCSRHRPFTCFNWHFPNQRRRRPYDCGNFKYSADIYCGQYDESTGSCTTNDCPYLHRVAGDVERRYHPRYYKTAMCVYETDSNGFCVRNGAHCAYAHGSDDLREPIFERTPPVQILGDPSSVRSSEGALSGDSLGSSVRPRSLSLSSSGGTKDKSLEDVRWENTMYVLANYKTELCRKPARACRQGYACPFYHNMRDRRRSPTTYKYRSTPCPVVKHSEEWGDPSQCPHSEQCPYCHTRTEQQFHPEIYKSTRCNDMLQTSTCPRGPFCAFAHHNLEICAARDLFQDNSPSSRSHPLPVSTVNHLFGQGNGVWSGSPAATRSELASSLVSSGIGSGSVFESPSSTVERLWGSNSFSYEDESEMEQAMLRRHLRQIENDPDMDGQEKARRKQVLMQSHAKVFSNGHSESPFTTASAGVPIPTSRLSNSLLSQASSHDDHLEFDFGSELEREIDIAISSSIGASSLGSCFSNGFGVHPLTGGAHPLTGMSPVALSSPSSVMRTPYMSTVHQQQHFMPTMRKESSLTNHCESAIPSLLKTSSPANHKTSHLQESGKHASEPEKMGKETGESRQRWHKLVELDEKMKNLRLKDSGGSVSLEQQLAVSGEQLMLLEAAYKQAQESCVAWDKELQTAQQQLRQTQEELSAMVLSKKEMESQLVQLKRKSVESSHTPLPDGYVVRVEEGSNLASLSHESLQQMRKEVVTSLERIDKALGEKLAFCCTMCNARRSVVCQPCGCCLLCSSCATKSSSCPRCSQNIMHTLPVILPG